MSSKYVRDQVKAFIASTFPTEKVIDISAEYREFSDLMEDESIGPDDKFIAIQFIGDRIDTISISSTNTKGCYREFGAIFIHIVEPVENGAIDNILTRGDSYIDAFTSQRLGQVVIEKVNPINTAQGATLEFQGGYTSGSIYMNYYRDRNL